jgi:molybdopterin converting factor small subunit
MINVKVKYMGRIKALTGVAEETISLIKSISVYDFIKNELCKRHNILIEYLFQEDDSIRTMVLIFHNDERLVENTSNILCNNDVITLIPPISGG